MRTRILLAAAVLSLAFAPAPLPKPGKKKANLKSLQGTWELLSLGAGRKARPVPAKASSIKVIVKDDRWSFSRPGGKLAQSYQMVFGAAGDLKTLDLLRSGSTTPTIRAIYVVEGDVWKICYSRRGERPKTLDGNDSTVVIMTLRREKR